MATSEHDAEAQVTARAALPRRWLCAFLLIEAVLLCEVVAIASILPYYEDPLFAERAVGGPDEYVHISVTEYLARHGQWPRWDSPELLRSGFGVSYSTAATALYWFYALCFVGTGHIRSGPVLAFIALLWFLFQMFRRSPSAGLFGLAALLPQVLFVFGYVNSDVQTVLAGIGVGFASATFILRAGAAEVVVLSVAAAVALTARQHLWPIALSTTAYALVLRRRSLRALPRNTLVLTLMLFIGVALWWPVTSMVANDGDSIGFVANAKQIARFSAVPKPAALGWEGLPIVSFINGTGASFYGLWGLMSLKLPLALYAVAVVSLASVVRVIGPLVGRHRLLMAFLLGLNVGLSLVYSAYYDYQPQGRYLFPAYFTVVGFTMALLSDSFDLQSLAREGRARHVSATLLTLIAINLLNSLYLLWQVAALKA